MSGIDPLSAILMTSGAGMQILGARQRASAAKASANLAEQQIRTQATAREVERSRKLRDIMSHNNAAAAARGLASGSGSLAALALGNADEFRLEQTADNVATSDRIRAIQFDASNQAREAWLGAASSIIGGAMDAGKGLLL